MELVTDPLPEIHCRAVELFNEISDKLAERHGQRSSVKLYLEQTYDGGATGMTQVLVEGVANEDLIAVAQLAREKGCEVDVNSGGLLLNLVGQDLWQGRLG